MLPRERAVRRLPRELEHHFEEGGEVFVPLKDDDGVPFLVELLERDGVRPATDLADVVVAAVADLEPGVPGLLAEDDRIAVLEAR
ncbi:MAG: hypothetical protein QG653_545 [Patescibacteria group bacterium]|nr:hypothetical protein [Patescibacteria group bacterium]